MRKENKHDVREQRLDNTDKSTFMVLTANEDSLEPHVFPAGGANGDELLHTNMAANCLFTLQDTAKRTL